GRCSQHKERPGHVVDGRGFSTAALPDPNRQYLSFIEDGGYRREELWQPAGWEFRRSEALEHPLYWRRRGSRWERRRFRQWEPLPPDEPVCHVCWYEAAAYARWAGRRLPTEADWEKAAAWGPSGRGRVHPWGDSSPDGRRANLWPIGGHPAAVGAFPDGASAWGVEQLLGDVWEWTSTDFHPYPGFRAFPY